MCCVFRSFLDSSSTSSSPASCRSMLPCWSFGHLWTVSSKQVFLTVTGQWKLKKNYYVFMSTKLQLLLEMLALNHVLLSKPSQKPFLFLSPPPSISASAHTLCHKIALGHSHIVERFHVFSSRTDHLVYLFTLMNFGMIWQWINVSPGELKLNHAKLLETTIFQLEFIQECLSLSNHSMPKTETAIDVAALVNCNGYLLWMNNMYYFLIFF